MNESIDRVNMRVENGNYDHEEIEDAIRDFVAVNGFVVGGSAYNRIYYKLKEEMHRAEIRAAWQFIKDNI